MSAPDELAEMKRYSPDEHPEDESWEAPMWERKDGDYVRFADADRVIAARDARIAELEVYAARLRKRITEMAALSQKHDRLILASNVPAEPSGGEK